VYRKGLSPFRVIKLFEEEGRQQFNPTYLMPILTNLTETYLRHEVLLSDGRKGMIVMINRNELSRPIVMVGNEAVDLMKERNLTIEAVY
jgi:HD-GYP domain-containing protein (c-di-GMP phosphodiesterase class II)